MRVSPSKGTSPQGYQQKRVVAANLVPQEVWKLDAVPTMGQADFQQVPYSRSRIPNFLRRSPTRLLLRTPPRNGRRHVPKPLSHRGRDVGPRRGALLVRQGDPVCTSTTRRRGICRVPPPPHCGGWHPVGSAEIPNGGQISPHVCRCPLGSEWWAAEIRRGRRRT